MGCLDEIEMFGEDSMEETGFGTCTFNQYEFDTSQVRKKNWNGEWSKWINFRELPLICDFNQKQHSLQNILINVCKGDNSGSKDTLKLELENGSGEKCETDPIENFVKDQMALKSRRYFDRQGNKCSNLELTSRTKVRLSNTGKNMSIIKKEVYRSLHSSLTPPPYFQSKSKS